MPTEARCQMTLLAFRGELGPYTQTSSEGGDLLKRGPVSSSSVQQRQSDAEGNRCEMITRRLSCPLYTHSHTHTITITHIFGDTPVRSQCPGASQRKGKIWEMTDITLTLGYID